VFSFDLPRSQVNSQSTNSETSIIPQIERLLTNTLSRNISNGSSTSRTTVTPPDSNNNNSNTTSRHDTSDDNNYP
jgi:hypothetical protein